MNLSSLLADIDYVLLWAILAACLVIIELLAVHGFFLSFALACGIMAVLIVSGLLEAEFLWQVLYVFILGTVFLPVVRRLIKSLFDKTPDINRY